MNKATSFSSIIKCDNLYKTYPDGKGSLLTILQPLNFELCAGDQVAIVGASGSGKSTLLHLLAGLDKPTGGTVWHRGKNVCDLAENERSALRNRTIGFVYQFHHLLPDLNALENVMLPLIIRRMPVEQAKELARTQLAAVKLSARLEHRPSMLSGGERQRVALARAFVTSPDCLLADEPTGNLDQYSAMSMFELMLELNQIHNTALLLVTHDESLADRLCCKKRLIEGVLQPA